MYPRLHRTNVNAHVRPLRAALAAVLAAVGVLTPATGASAATYPSPETISGSTYAHDPSMVKAGDGRYYLFYTGGGIHISTSTDRVHWSSAGEVLPGGATWAQAYGGWNDIWAPDVSYHNGVYWLYYAVSSFGSNHSAIGLATSGTAAPGSWTDRGMVYSSQSSSDYNAIDPALLVDGSGRWWLSFGSFWSGIKMIQIDPSTGKQLATNTTRYSIAQRSSPDALEASYIYPHGGYYYLFTSFDYCCRGTSSTYRIMVARSTNPTGPYTDENAVASTSGGGTQILGTHDNVIGPGGQSVMHDSDGDVLVYHYYDGNQNGTAQLGLDHLAWGGNGWPTVVNGGTGSGGGSGGGGSGGGGSGGGGSGGGGGTTTGPIHAVGAGKCLDDPNGTTTQGTQMQIYTCNGLAPQNWTRTTSGQLTVTNNGTTLCLDANGRGTTNGTKVIIWACNGQTNQQWQINSNGTITGVQSGLCLDVTGGSTANGALVELWTCNGGSNQQWTMG